MNIVTESYGKVLTPSDASNVLCDGYSVGRKVIVPPSNDGAAWQEMTEAQAAAVIATNTELNPEGLNTSE